ncbi:MAG: Uncharacterized protein Athens071426_607 [Parcubacteria group bacterium Athens0714_26]|nr:MAG: Uncharacterized protein Athens071426_607 [Parcubacteria group bacterium Athens0714_26]
MIKKIKKLKFILGTVFVILALSSAIFSLVFAATTISSAYRWAWNDAMGWIDFYSSGNVSVTTNELTGYASSQVGDISLNCSSTPNGDICSGPAGSWKVSNDGMGALSGWAWNDNIGWISFSCLNTGNCSIYNYEVTVDGDGYFNGYAWNDVVGWISFNCANPGTNGCSSPGIDYKVKTTPFISKKANLTSSTFDTGVAQGVSFNSLIYQGTKPAGTDVKFQFASSDTASGPWIFKGLDGSDATYYVPTGPNVPVLLIYSQNNNKRYFRYKIFLDSDQSQTVSPIVDQVIINWSL